MRAFLRAEFRRHPWMAPGLAITASAALGSAFTDIVAAIARVLS